MSKRTTSDSVIQPITNKAFLQAIFGNKYRRAHCTAFKEDPHKVDRALWGGKHYQQLIDQFGPKAAVEDKYCNTYFTISLFSPDPTTGKSVRRKEQHEETFLVVVDDVHEKVSPEKLKELGFPPPSYRIETSPGNEQWGYLFKIPVTKRHYVEHLLNQWVAKGITCDGTDPGMKGVTRYVRLPVGSNTKACYGKPFRHRLLGWNPDRRYTLEELARSTGVDMETADQMDTLRAQTIIPEKLDPVLLALSEAGLLKHKVKPGVYELSLIHI